MEQENVAKQPEGKAGIYLLVVITIVLIIYVDSLFFKASLAGLLVLSFVSAGIGQYRKIGYNNAFLATFFLGGILGFVITLASKRIDEIPTAITISTTNNTSLADELLKLNELKEKGILTEEEFAAQKERLLQV